VAAPPHAGLKAQQGEASGISSPVFTSFSARASDLQPTTRFALLLELWVLGPRVSGLCDQAVGHPCVRGGCGGTSLAGTISCSLAPCRFLFFFFLKRFAPGVGLVGGTGGQPALLLSLNQVSCRLEFTICFHFLTGVNHLMGTELAGATACQQFRSYLDS
jgi:hypothetical protein